MGHQLQTSCPSVQMSVCLENPLMYNRPSADVSKCRDLSAPFNVALIYEFSYVDEMKCYEFLHVDEMKCYDSRMLMKWNVMILVCWWNEMREWKTQFIIALGLHTIDAEWQTYARES